MARFTLVLAVLFAADAARQPAVRAQEASSTTRTQYEIELDVDFQQAKLTGRATVRFFNTSRRKAERLSFVLYPNIGLTLEDEPLVIVEQVRSISAALKFEVKNERLEVQLEQPLEAGQSVEVQIDYRATAPRIDEAETTLPAHLTDQVAVALGRTRRARSGKSSFFAAGQTMVLARPYPVLAVFERGEWKFPPSSSPADALYSDVADYSVAIWSDEPMQVLATGMDDQQLQEGARYLTRVRAHRVRDFGAVLLAAERRTKKLPGNVPVELLCDTDEAGCQRVESITTKTAAIFSKLYGSCPFEALKVLVVPLPSEEISVAQSGLVLISSAFARHVRLPAEQAIFMSAAELSPLVEGTLETSLVTALAAQWWGLGVGFDPSRHLYFAEALRSYAVSQYFESLGEGDAYEKQLRTTYRIYRTFGGLDHPARRNARQYANDFELSAIASAKGTLFLKTLSEQLGRGRLNDALRSISEEKREQIVTPEEALDTISSRAEGNIRINDLFSRWFEQRHGDEDVAQPEFVITISRDAASPASGGGNVFARMGRFFFTQMTRVGKSASKPF